MASDKKLNADIALDGKRGKMYIHPSSVISNLKLRSNYMLYLEAQVTSKVYARDMTSINPIVCMLFASHLKVYEDLNAVVIDSWLGFKVKPIQFCVYEFNWNSI